MKKMIMVDANHKWEINENMVELFELCGGRWVSMGGAERWSDQLINELVEA